MGGKSPLLFLVEIIVLNEGGRSDEPGNILRGVFLATPLLIYTGIILDSVK
jgi:hypothetical protein